MMWGYNYGYPMMNYSLGWLHILFTVFWALVLAFIIIGVLRFLRGKGRSHGRNWLSENSAMEILRERYARGEIGREEFEEKKKDLSL